MSDRSAEVTLEPLLTAAEVAGLLKLSVRQVWRLAAGGKLPQPIHIGRSARWRSKDLAAVLDGKDGVAR